MDEKREILVLTDGNMDHNNLVFNHSFKIDKLRKITKKFLSENNFTTHNDSHTYFIKQTPTSCIDHIYSNCPHKITHVTTLNTGQSDHSILTAKYHTKAPITNPKLVFTRQKHLITRHTLN